MSVQHQHSYMFFSLFLDNPLEKERKRILGDIHDTTQGPPSPSFTFVQVCGEWQLNYHCIVAKALALHVD